VLACALGANVDYIVTGDEDLLVLDGHPALGSLRIVTPRAFLTILEQLTGDA
jgi:predicted nucleic acid-binding protein